MAQSNDSTAARMCFVLAMLRQLGPRSYPGYSSDFAQPREDTGLSPAEAVFETPIVLPSEFLHGEEISIDNISKNFWKTLDAPAFSLFSKHNSSCLLPEELPADLLRAPFIWSRRGSVVPLFQRPYDSPYAVLYGGPRSFTIRVGLRDEVFSVNRLKACTDADATPGSPRCLGSQASHCLPRRSSWYQAGLISRSTGFFTFSGAGGWCQETVKESFFSHPVGGGGVLHALDWRHSHRLHRCDICSDSGLRP
jgi:hypothetical protein